MKPIKIVERRVIDNVPKDGSENRAHGESTRITIVDIPDTIAKGMAMMRSVNGVINGHNHR